MPRRVRLPLRLPASAFLVAGIVTAIPPAARADDAAQSAVVGALKAADAQPGFHAHYQSRIEKTGSDPFVQEGDAWREGALLYREARREEDKDPSIRFYRHRAAAGDTFAVWTPRGEEWLTRDQAGDQTLGKGLEDPDVAMAFLQTAVVDAEKTGAETIDGTACDVYRVRIDRKKLAQRVKEQTQQEADDLDWENGTVDAQVAVGGTPVVPRRFAISGSLPVRNAKPDKAEKVTILIRVEVKAYGAQARLAKVPAEAKAILGMK